MSLDAAGGRCAVSAMTAGHGYETVRGAVALAFSFAGFRFDPGTGLERGGRRIPLAPTERRTPATLLRAGGRIVTKDELAERVWGGAPASDNSISRAICAIRRTLRRYSSEQVIETIYASGFRLSVPVDLAPAPWSPHAESAALGLQPVALASLQAARELLKGGRPSDVREAAAEVERALRLLSGRDWRWSEPAA
jgi:DNA-binding winged helix-turn-helix (wHTH) protein